MLFFINTAKTFVEDAESNTGLTEPVFKAEADSLVDSLAKLSIRQLERLMHISSKIAEQNHNRYANWSGCQKLPALQAFNGDIYKKLKAEPLTKANWNFAQKHLRILSGLYGILKPKDAINPYRLEMYTKMKHMGKKDLHDFWRDLLTKQVNLELAAMKAKYLVNLASNEYFSALNLKKLDVPVVNVTFKERTDKGLKIVAIYSKQARGLMARYIIDQEITDPEKMKAFDLDGYQFSANESNENCYTFVRA